ncbi:hypothetical protein MAR_002128 [Mya arenaria]|uniref:Uncharacterized protein n=1 Tax=Mya arenaria TaxID=6604 RepID=A0ABY7FDR3_MYAAR|nr:hypothetical protein MAR_002128 [Mya arenaria]
MDKTGQKAAQDTVSDSSFNDGQSAAMQAQTQEQLLRQTEASRQMLYGVYGNVITILEEHEKRTSAVDKGKLKQSDIAIPDQSWKTNEDVKANVETQLLLFETQSKFCPKEVRLSVNRELRLKTIAWFGVREESKLDIEETDTFACKLYEILVQGETKHESLDRPRSPITEKTIRETLPNIFKGQHDARLSRIGRTNPKLKDFLDEDWSLIQQMGSVNIR